MSLTSACPKRSMSHAKQGSQAKLATHRSGLGHKRAQNGTCATVHGGKPHGTRAKGARRGRRALAPLHQNLAEVILPKSWADREESKFEDASWDAPWDVFVSSSRGEGEPSVSQGARATACPLQHTSALLYALRIAIDMPKQRSMRQS